MANADPGLFIISAKLLLKKNRTTKPIAPMINIRVLDSLKTLSASLNCPTAYLSETIFDIATGIPVVANTSKNP